jgi:hypothetical protein
MTSNKFESEVIGRLRIEKFVNSEGEVIKQGLLSTLSTFPFNKTKDTAKQG